MAKPKTRGGAKLSKIDEELDESFPASDPPAFMGGNHIIGAPPREKKARKVKTKKARPVKKAKTKIKRAKKTTAKTKKTARKRR